MSVPKTTMSWEKWVRKHSDKYLERWITNYKNTTREATLKYGWDVDLWKEIAQRELDKRKEKAERKLKMSQNKQKNKKEKGGTYNSAR